MASLIGFLPEGTSRRRLVEETAYFALRPRTFVVFGAITLIATLLRTVRWDLVSTVDAVIFLSVSLLIYIIGGVVGNVLLRRISRRVLPLAAGLLWSAIAATRRIAELLVVGTVEAVGVEVSPFPIILAIASTLVWVILIAGLQAVNVLRRQTLNEVEANIRRLRELSDERWVQLEDERITMARWIRRTVTPTLDQLSALIASTRIQWQEPGFVKHVGEIAESSRELVRQASHSMTRLEGRADVLNVKAQVVLDESPRNRPTLVVQEVRIAPLSSALVGLAVLGFSIPALRPVSLLALAVGLPVAFAVLWLLQLAVEPIHKRTGTPRIVGVLVANFIAVLVALIAADSAARWFKAQWFPDTTATPFILPFVEPGFVVVLMVASLIVTTGAALVVADAQVWAQAEVRLKVTRTELDLLDRDITRQYEQMCAQSTAMLHGPIQGRLATIAMTLRFEGHTVSRETIESCRAMLDACKADLVRVAEDPFCEHRCVDEVLEGLRAQWSGLLVISWELDPTTKMRLDGNASLLRTLETLIADLASNSSRHGSAHRLQLALTPDADGIRIVARDDGKGPELPVTLGMGLSDAQERTSQIEMDADGWCKVNAHLSLS